MKTKSKHLSATLAAALFFGVSVLSAFAGPTAGGYVPVRTSADAKALPQKSNVMMACSGCQSIKPLEKTGILAWFETKQKHDCPRCGGKVTFTGAPGKSTTGTKFTHSCSMCGNASAYVCATQLEGRLFYCCGKLYQSPIFHPRWNKPQTRSIKLVRSRSKATLMKSSSESSDASCLVCGKSVDQGGGFCRLAIGDVMVALCCPLCLDTFNGDKLRFEAKLAARSAGLLDNNWFTP